MTPDNEDFEITKSIFDSEMHLFKQNRDYNPDPYPYYKFIPKYYGEYPPNFSNSITGHCFQTISISVSETPDHNVTIEFNLNGKLGSNCSESFIISTGAQTKVETFHRDGIHSVDLDSQMETGLPANQWDLYVRGPRIFRFPIDLTDAIRNLAATRVLFESHETGEIIISLSD